MFSEIGRTYIAGLFSPTSIIGVILISGVVMLWRNKRYAKLVITIGVASFVFMSMAPLKTTLYSFVEKIDKQPDDYEYVVVLGGKIFSHDEHPISSQITPSLLSRLGHAIAMVKAKPGTTLVLTGNGAEKKTEADLMYQYARQMGVETQWIVLENESMNTSDHPRYLKSLLNGKKFAIVTSAYHMPRALELFEAQGLKGYPYPTDFQNKSSLALSAFIMRGENLSALDRIFTEIYSSFWSKIKSIF